MSDWPDLVTTALLGTGRRPLPTGLPVAWAREQSSAPTDPAVRLLDLAARHRAVSRAATPLPGSASLTEVAPRLGSPAADRPGPPDEAVEVLGGLLLHPVPALINFWLRCAEATGCGVPAAYWTRLARLAAHSTAYERTLLGRVLGARGRWFLRQNPDWHRLAADAEGALKHAQGTTPRAGRPRPTAETVRARPKSIFDHPDPWPTDLVAAAYAVLGSGSLGRAAREFAAGVGARLPFPLYRSLGAAAAYYLEAPEASPALRRQVREGFVILEEAAWARVRIERAFADPGAPTSTPRRVEIPGV